MNLIRAARAGWQSFRAVASTSTPDYKAASTGRRLQSFLPSNTGPNTLIFSNGDLLRARARSLCRQNPWAAGALDSFVGNAIGTGIKPQSQHPDPEIKDRTQRAWMRWTDEADANWITDFYGLQAQVCRAVMQDGEVFVRLRFRRPEDKLSVPLQLQIIESDFVPLSETKTLTNGNRVLGGIELNAIGKRVAYWMHRDHPGESQFRAVNLSLARISADEVLHIYRPVRPGQLRGQPWLTPAITLLYDLEQYVDATVMRAKLANLMAFFIQKTNTNPTLNEEDNGDGTALAGVQPGSVHYLDPNEAPIFNEPIDPGADFATFLKTMLRAVARALGITYEQLTGDLEGVNYSSIRAGLLEFRRWCEAFQHQVIAYQFCRPVWRMWIEEAVLADTLPALAFRNVSAWDARWIPPGWPWVDPVKDIKAAVEGIRAGLTSRSAVVSETGEDAERIDEEQAADNKRADDLELKYDSDGRNPAKGPSGQQAEEEPEAPAKKKKEAA